MSDELPLDEEPDESGQALEISLANAQTALQIDDVLLIGAARQILTDAGFQTGEISLAIVDDPTIHELNRNYLDHDYPTDVLSFPLTIEESHVEGEVVVSADTAIREAAEVGWPTHTELLLYVVHGLLHLCGHDDHDPSGRHAMRAAEKDYLLQAGIPANDIDSRLPDATIPHHEAESEGAREDSSRESQGEVSASKSGQERSR